MLWKGSTIVQQGRSAHAESGVKWWRAKGRLAREKFVENNAKRVDVGGRCDRSAQQLFRAGVSGRNGWRGGHVGFCVDEFGSAEVKQFDAPFGGDEYVARL